MTLAPDHLKDLAQRYTAAWCSQDPARVAAFFSPNGWLRVNDDEPALGRDAIMEVARGFMNAFPDLQVRMDDLLVENGRVVYRWALTGHNTGHGGRGQRVRISGFEEWKIGGDALIAESRGASTRWHISGNWRVA
jgi:predicted ester cyclase